jgi:acetylornithine deacetylase/succinyl-diaminopimelate desuccinylase-like protein
VRRSFSRSSRQIVLPLLSASLAGGLSAQQPPVADPRGAAREYRESREGTILREFTELLAIPNVAADSANIRRNAALLMEMLRRRGAQTRLLEVEGSPPAVFGEIRTPGATRTLVLYAHYDGQPVDTSEWAVPPWKPVLRERSLAMGGREIPLPEDGARAPVEARIYARSASDDKGSIIAMLTALDAMKAARIPLSVNLKFFFEGEEEAGSGHLRQILERHAGLLAADAWLFCDGPVHQSGRMQVVFGVRGVVGLELAVHGPTRALHSGHYGNWAPNPGILLARLLASMRDEDGRILIRGFHDDVRPLSASERRALAAVPSVDSMLRASLGLARSESANAPLAERVMRPALNLRGMRVGGVREGAANAIPTEALASIDFRLVPNQTPERVRTLVERHIRAQGFHIVRDSADAATRRRYPKIVRLEWEPGYPASRVSMDLLFSRALMRSVAEGAASPPLAVPTLGGSGPVYIFEQVLDVPMVVLPIANFDNSQHASNENLRLANLWDGIEMYASLLARIGVEWREGRVVP